MVTGFYATTRRVWMLAWRHLTILLHPAQLLDTFFWASLDVLTFGFASAQLARMVPGDQYLSCAFVVAVLACRCLASIPGQFMATSLVRELGEGNFVALFTTPLRFGQWLVSGFIVGSASAFVRLFLSWIAVSMALSVCIQIPFWFAFAGIFLLLFFGWTMGLVLMSLTLTIGRAAQSWIWITMQVFFLLSGVLCSLDALPAIVRAPSLVLPLPYLFDALRNLFTGGPVVSRLMLCGALDCLYFAGGLALVWWAFGRCKNAGLTHLEQL